MSAQPLEERVAALEAEVARLRAKVEGGPAPMSAWWNEIAGTFADDPVYDEAMRLGREYRESSRPKPRKRKKDAGGHS